MFGTFKVNYLSGEATPNKDNKVYPKVVVMQGTDVKKMGLDMELYEKLSVLTPMTEVNVVVNLSEYNGTKNWNIVDVLGK